LFSLIVSLARHLSKYDRSIDQSFNAGLPPDKIALAGRAILGWPDKFMEFADSVSKARDEHFGQCQSEVRARNLTKNPNFRRETPLGRRVA